MSAVHGDGMIDGSMLVGSQNSTPASPPTYKL